MVLLPIALCSWHSDSNRLCSCRFYVIHYTHSYQPLTWWLIRLLYSVLSRLHDKEYIIHGYAINYVSFEYDIVAAVTEYSIRLEQRSLYNAYSCYTIIDLPKNQEISTQLCKLFSRNCITIDWCLIKTNIIWNTVQWRYKLSRYTIMIM